MWEKPKREKGRKDDEKRKRAQNGQRKTRHLTSSGTDESSHQQVSAHAGRAVRALLYPLVTESAFYGFLPRGEKEDYKIFGGKK